MRSFTQLVLSLLVAVCLTGFVGCQDPGGSQVSKADTSHEDDHDDDHEHDDHEHGDHDDHEHGDHDDHEHDGDDHSEHEHPENYDDGMAELVSMHETIKSQFAKDEIGDDHGPLHDVGHLLEDIEKLVEKSDMDDAAKKSCADAIENLFGCFGAVDDKLHGEEGKDYDEVAEQIESSIQALQQHVTTKSEE